MNFYGECKDKRQRSHPLSLLTAFAASSPKGTPLRYAGNFTATAKSRPLGEGGIAAGDDGRGIRGAHSKSSCLQKKYLSPQVKIASGGKIDYTIKKPAVYRPQGRM